MKKIYVIIFIVFCFTGRAYSQFSESLAGTTLITTGWNIGGYATVVDSFVQLTTSAGSENGYVYFDSLVNLTSCSQFTIKFDYNISDPGGLGFADGIAFFYIANPPAGFVIGGGLGIPDPITGMIFTLDTWDNDGDGLNPESELFGYTTPSTYSEGNRTQLITGIRGHETFMDDGTWHHCEIDYNAGNINVYFDYSTVPGMTGYYLITIPGGYFGFSSSTGGGYSVQSVKSIYITANGISPAPTVVSPLVYCQYATADTLSATGTGPFSWFTTDTARVDSLPGAPVPSTAVAGTTWYYVRSGIGGCISVPDSIEVIVNPQPAAPVIHGTTVYCQDTTFIPFTVTGTGTILWYPTDTGGTGSSTPPVINTTIAGTTTWWATQTISGCESPRDSIKVTVHATPSLPTITGTSVYCQYFPYIPVTGATTGVGTNLLWYTSATSLVGSTTVPTVNTNVAGSYFIYATQEDSGCISPKASFNVTVNPKPAPPVISAIPSNYCPGQPFIPFSIVSGSNILWYAGPVGGTGSVVAPGVNTSVPGTYTFYASQTVLGCESDRVAVTVTVADNLQAGFTWQVKYGCKGDTVYFANTSVGATNYKWEFGDISPYSILPNPTHVYITQDTFNVTLVAVTNPCADSVTESIPLYNPLHAQFAADSTLICQGKRVIFTDSSYGTGISYLWSFGDGSFTTSANPMHTYPHEGIYKVFEVVKDFVPCTDTAFITIAVDTISPMTVALTDTVICRGTYVTFTGNYSAIGFTGITWNLDNGDTVKDINPLVYAYQTLGTFTVTASATYRVCPDTNASRKITVIPAPVIDLGPDTSICKGGQPILIVDETNKNTPGASWVWSTGGTGPAISITEPGTYSVVVKIDGCPASYSLQVRNDCYMEIPNVFTPNGDGLNDYFFPRSLLTSGLISFKMDIFNRWGQLVFESTTLDGRGWDGKLNNTDQPEGVYVYEIDATFKDGQMEHHQGNVTLIR